MRIRPSTHLRGVTSLALLLGVALPALALEPPVGDPPGAAPFRFVDRGREAGLIHPTLCGGPDKQHLMASGGSGVALFDYDSDGLLDIYLVNSWSYGGGRLYEKPLHRLYRNLGGVRFEDVTVKANAGLDDFGCGIACADYDSDGDLDIYVTCWGPNRLLRNEGDGAFREVGKEAGVDDPGWSTGAAFFDADRDGDLDLYVANYLATTTKEVLEAKKKTRWRSAVTVMDGPFGMPGDADHYYVNLGNGRFRDATKEAGVVDVGKYFGYTVVPTDIDDDGDIDLYVANDSNPNFLYINDGTGKFRDEALVRGAALSGDGAGQASMGADVADFDLDGLLDIVVTNFAMDYTTLYANIGDALFEDVSKRTGVAQPTYQALEWGVVLQDLDLDMYPDLYVATGHIYPEVDEAPKLKESFRQRDILLENREGKFADVTADSGPGLQIIESSRGVAYGDVDDDGDVDILVTNMDAVPNLLINESPRRGRYLTVKLVDAPRTDTRSGRNSDSRSEGRP